MGKASRLKKERAEMKMTEETQPKAKPGNKVVKITAEALEKRAAELEATYKKVSRKMEELIAKKIGKESAFPKKEIIKILKKTGITMAGIFAVVAIMIVIELHSAGRIFPGTKANGVDVSYMPVQKAREKLRVEINKYLAQPLIFSYQGDTFEVKPEEISLQIGVEQTLVRLPSFRFSKESPPYLFATLFSKREIAGDYTLDGDKIIKVLEQKLNLTDKKAQNAGFYYDEKKLNIRPEKDGISINREKLIRAMRANIDNLSSATINVETENTAPRITAARLEQEKDRLLELLNRPVTLYYGDDTLKIKLIDNLDAVSFGEKNSLSIQGQKQPLPIIMEESRIAIAHASPATISSDITIQIDPEKLSAFLADKLINKIETPVSPVNIYEDENSKIIIEGKGEDGRSVAKDRLAQALALAANSGINSVPVPVLIDRAPMTVTDDLSKKGITELIATGHSSYYGSPPNRMFNINFGVQKYNGMLIAPGEEFSFNAHLGEVDAKSGFLPEKVIKENKIELEFGGGICQVSTTLYRAALIAGLPITDRTPHSWKVSYYSQSMGDGLDATVYPGVADLKFLNDTPGWLLIQSYTEGPEAYFKLYGTDDGRIAQLDGPYGGGLTYHWNRIVKKDGKEIAEEIWSRYKPIPPPEPPPKVIAENP
ncbi:VanW family protein [Patescibacteria group bacterium]|nr:VanW family protein [Patescibacteria group bacterium]MBU1703473.1 VanW family protein [Patescibacteria group bacterium]MBU1953445.1 VanW family protein [Patescibacteria group bacterium]